MRSLTNSEISYNKLLGEVEQIEYFIKTSSEILDENYYNMLILNAKVNLNEDALKQYRSIKKIGAMKKEEQSTLLEYDENGELNIHKYGLNEYSKIYVLSKYLDIKELLKVENLEDRFTKIKKIEVSEAEIARILCDEKNEYLREFILTTKIENDNGKLVPAVNMIFEDKENIKKLLFSAKKYSKAIAENIITGEYGNLSKEEANLAILNSGENNIEGILKNQNCLLAKNDLREEILKKYAIIRNLKDANGKLDMQENINIPEKMTLGVELEIVGPASSYLYGEMLKDFKGKNDITVKDEKYSGVEIVSPILNSNNACNVLSVAKQLVALGEYTNKSCGCHVHIGAKYLEIKDDVYSINEEATKLAWKSLLEMWKSTEEIMYKITSPEGEAHRGIRYAKPIASKIEEMLAYDDIGMNTFEYKEMIKKVQTEAEPIISERFFSLNFSNLNEGKDTLEFRLANGTIDSKELKANMEIFASFVDAARRIGIIRYKEKNKVQLTENEEELLEKHEKLTKKVDMSENEKKNILLNILFDNEKKEIYDKRYEKSSFDLVKEENKYEFKQDRELSKYGAELLDSEIRQVQEYKSQNRKRNVETKFEANDFEDLVEEIKERRNIFENLFTDMRRRRAHRRRNNPKHEKEDLER